MSFGTVYSAQLARLRVNLGLGVVLFTAPAGYVSVIREIDAYCFSTAAPSTLIGVGGPTIWLGSWVMTAGESHQWTGQLVMSAGQQLLGQGASGSGQDTGITISGYLLSGSSPV